MLRRAKSFIKARPRLFDVSQAIFATVGFRQDALDRFLDRFAKRTNRGISFVQIGANDGLRSDPIRRLIIRDRWAGILVEPVPTVFRMLTRNYAYLGNRDLRFVNAAISSNNQADLAFYCFSQDFLATLDIEERLEYSRKSSFDRSLLEHYASSGRRRGRFLEPRQLDAIITSIRVPILTFDQLMAEYGKGLPPLDLVVIDAEGHEPEILSSIGFGSHRPDIIIFESAHLGPSKVSVFEQLVGWKYDVVELEKDAVASLQH